MLFKPSVKIEKLTDAFFENIRISYPIERGVVGFYKKLKWLRSLSNSEISGDDVISFLSPTLLYELENGSKHPIFRRALYKAGMNLVSNFGVHLNKDELIAWKDSFDFEARKKGRFKASKESIQYAQLGLLLTTNLLGKDSFGTREMMMNGAFFGLSQGGEVAKISAINLIYNNYKVDAAVAVLSQSIDSYTEKSKKRIIEVLFENRSNVIRAVGTLGKIGKREFVEMLDNLLEIFPKKIIQLLEDFSENENGKNLQALITITHLHGIRHIGSSDFERLSGLCSNEIFSEILDICLDTSFSEAIRRKAKNEFILLGDVTLTHLLGCAKDIVPSTELNDLLFEFIQKYPLESLYWLSSRASYLPVTEGASHNHLLEVFWSMFVPYLDEGDTISDFAEPKYVHKLKDRVELHITSTEHPESD